MQYRNGAGLSITIGRPGSSPYRCPLADALMGTSRAEALFSRIPEHEA
jgi:hypothetical protein